MPSGIEALEQMQLGKALEAVPQWTQRTGAAYLNARPIVAAAFEPSFFRGRPPRAVSQPALLEMLVAEAGRCRGFEFERGASVLDLLADGGRVAGVRVRTTSGEHSLRADLVVGADGRSSAVRKHARLAARRIDQPMDIVWCKLPLPDGWVGVRAYLGRGHLLMAYRSWDDALQLGWVILKGTFGALRSRGIAEWVEEMANHVTADLAAHLRAHGNSVRHPFLLDAVSECTTSWSVPGALLIGDAAHTMSPVGGQGINVALRDAIVATNHLLPVLAGATRDDAGLEAASRAVEAERMREIRPLQRLQSVPPRVVLTRAWWGEPVRSLLAWLARRPALQRRTAGQADAFLFGLTDVRLRT